MLTYLEPNLSQFFVELWAEIVQNPTLHGHGVSNPLLPDLNVDETENPNTTLFEALISVQNSFNPLNNHVFGIQKRK